MLTWELWFAIVPGIVLFLYGIEHLSKEIQRAAGERFRDFLSKTTKTTSGGTILGTIVTVLVQSSTATTVIAVSLVDTGTISFSQSLGIIFGANIGTTITTQLIAFNFMAFAPFFILLGFVMNAFESKYKILGKSVFYFGLIFFSFSLLNSAISPFKNDPEIISFFSQFSNVYISLLVGIIATIIFQSSAVTNGIILVLAGNGILGIQQCLPLLLGTNIGTTSTSLLASLRMGIYAKRASVAHLLFNIGGAILFLPFLGPFSLLLEYVGGSPVHQVANAHLFFNVFTAAFFLLMINPFKKLIEKIIVGSEEEILFRTKYLENGLPPGNKKAIELIENELKNAFEITLKLFDNSAEFLRDKNQKIFRRVEKLESLNDFLNEKIEKGILEISNRRIDEEEARKTVVLVRISNEIERLGDSADALAYVSSDMSAQGKSFSPESLVELTQIYEKFKENMCIMTDSTPYISNKNIKIMRKNDLLLRNMITSSYNRHLKRLYQQKAYAGTFFVEALSTIEQANSNLREIRKLSEEYSRLITNFNRN